MSKKNYYDLQTVMGLRDVLRDLVFAVVKDAFAFHQDGTLNTRPTQSYPLITTEGRTELIDIFFSGNPMEGLGKDLEAVGGIQATAVTMTIFIHGTPWGINLTQEDIGRGLEKTLRDHATLKVADSLLEHIVAAMAREWYRYGLSDRIGTYVEAQDFEAITKQFNGMIDACWDGEGYTTRMLMPTSGSDEMHVVKQDMRFNALNQGYPKGQSHKDVCLRMVHQYAIILITLGMAEEGFTWPLVEM